MRGRVCPHGGVCASGCWHAHRQQRGHPTRTDERRRLAVSAMRERLGALRSQGTAGPAYERARGALSAAALLLSQKWKPLWVVWYTRLPCTSCAKVYPGAAGLARLHSGGCSMVRGRLQRPHQSAPKCTANEIFGTITGPRTPALTEPAHHLLSSSCPGHVYLLHVSLRRHLGLAPRCFLLLMPLLSSMTIGPQGELTGGCRSTRSCLLKKRQPPRPS